MITGDETTVTDESYGITQFCKQLYKAVNFDIFWRLLEMNLVLQWQVTATQNITNVLL